MGIFSEALDWAADKAQTFSGEKERRERVAEIKGEYEAFRIHATENVNCANESIEDFNASIKKLNDLRSGNVVGFIEYLGRFLERFGCVKKIGEYAEEESRCYVSVPEKSFISIEDYISKIDLSKDDVFMSSFLLGPIGTKIRNQHQNLSMQEQLNALKLFAEQTILELNKLKFNAEQDKRISELYMFCVKRIINYIEKVVVPELDVVEAFFQALAIKNKVIADNSLENIEFKNNINLLRDTQYAEHYQFIKNAFIYYVVACKIYNTPVLTNLLNGRTSENDWVKLNEEKDVMEVQMNNVNQYLIFMRKEI